MNAPQAATTELARTLTSARLNHKALPGYPGAIPADLTEAYACQDAAIDLWPDELGGWKVGGIQPAFIERLGATRSTGPVFRKILRHAKSGETLHFLPIKGGSACVEAEIVCEIASDAPTGKTEWSAAEVLAMVHKVYWGIELAGSALPNINGLGTLAVISDFCNNAGMAVGPEITDWRTRKPQDFSCETFVDGLSAGKCASIDLATGPLEALRFTLSNCAQRGRPLRRGMFITTGAVTGVHDMVQGQSARIAFAGFGDITCVAD